VDITAEMKRLGMTPNFICVVQEFNAWFNSMSYSMASVADKLSLTPEAFNGMRFLYLRSAHNPSPRVVEYCRSIGYEAQEYLKSLADQTYPEYERAMLQMLVAYHMTAMLYCKYFPPISVIDASVELATYRTEGEVCTVH